MKTEGKAIDLEQSDILKSRRLLKERQRSLKES